MVSSSELKAKWHYETLPTETKKAFEFLSQAQWLNDTTWYLAGGTALALQTGNRKSFDLDFFTTERDFEIPELLAYFSGLPDWKLSRSKKNTLYGELYGAKISFIAYPFFVPQQSMLKHGLINVLDKTDIAVMKVIAVSQRGRKRDFFDLYWCVKNIESLASVINRLPIQYPGVAHNYHHILKSLFYFNDAEEDPEPEIYFKANWNLVKDFFKKEVPRLTRELIGLV